MKRKRRHKRVHRPHKKGRYVVPDSNGQGTGRIVVCGVVFVLLVAVKLLFPSYGVAITRTVNQFLTHDVDFQAAFSAVGRAVSGEDGVENALRDAYVAVFHPEDEAVEVGGSGIAAEVNYGTVATLARHTALPKPERQEAQTDTSQDEPVAEQETAAVEDSSRYTMAALPEDASLEQLALAFSYTTPVAGTLSSPFGWRQHPVVGEELFHYGIDLAAEKGTDICAFADGEVFATGESSTLGKYIMLTHEGGYRTLYAHCSRVTVGSGSVTLGQKIGEVGETGRATGPHLHFELHYEGVYYNPIYYLEIG